MTESEVDNAKLVDDFMPTFPRLTKEMTQHLKSLYIRAHFEGRPISRVPIDNGAAVNILPMTTMRRIGKSESDLILIDLVITNFTRG